MRWRTLAANLRGATRPQVILPITAGIAGIGLAWACAANAGASWETWQWALVVVVAFDLCGGVVAMCTRTVADRIRASRRPWLPLIFTAVHVHPLIIPLLLPQVEWAAIGIVYATPLLGVILLNFLPSEFRSGVALSWCLAGLILSSLALSLPGLEWFVPAYLLKLTGSWAAAPGASALD